MKTEGSPRSESLAEFWGLPGSVDGPPAIEADFHRYLHERYPEAGRAGGSSFARAYYRLKPILPRAIQIWARQRHARLRRQSSFPRWPLESRCWDLATEWLREVTFRAGSALPTRAFWPNGKRFALVLTHDVEHQAGFDGIKTIVRTEEDLGLRSSWNLVPERYRIDRAVIKWLWDRGHEVGVHGLTHDGKLFSSRKMFEERLTAIHRYAKAWGARGFRSPATYRNALWMQSMKFEYDASFFDTDPYEPQHGGCCHVFPYRLGRFIELPYTLPQDHTLFHVLRTDASRVWLDKARWIRSVGGMVLMVTHPDYLDTEERRAIYRRFLEEISGWEGMWHALPMDVARWWSARLNSYATLRPDGTLDVVSRDSRAGMKLTAPASSIGH